MKLVCVSHACVVRSNQAFFAHVAELTGWDVTIVLPLDWRNELGTFRADRWPGFAGALEPLHVVGRGRIPLHVYAARMGKLLRRIEPDVVYVHNEPYALATLQGFAAARRLPVGFYTAQNVLKRYPPPFSLFERWVYRRASFAFPTSEEVLAVLRSKGYQGPATVLPLAVDLDALGSPAMTTAPTGDGLVVGFVGRLVPEKGVETLLDALALAPVSVRAVIAGAGAHADLLRSRAVALGIADRVEWRGYVPHEKLSRVYRELDLLVVPSRTTGAWREQFGRVVIEALAVGVPVLASASGSLPGLVAQTGGGWTFPEGDASELAARLRTLLEDRAALREAATKGRAAVERSFGLSAVASVFAAAIEEATGRVVRSSLAPAGAS